MPRPSIFGSAVTSSGSPSPSRKKRRTRSRNSSASSSAKILPSDSIGTLCRTLPNFSDGAAPTCWRRAFAGREFRMLVLDGEKPLPKRVIIGVGDGWRVVLIIAPVVLGDLGREPPVFRDRFVRRHFGNGLRPQAQLLSHRQVAFSRSYRERYADLRHHDVLAFHLGQEFRGVLIDDREGAVMDRDDGLELEDSACRRWRPVSRPW